MIHNVGATDRKIRVILGVAFVGVEIYFHSRWLSAMMGIYTFFTSVVGWCAVYRLFGINTCKTKIKSRGRSGKMSGFDYDVIVIGAGAGGFVSSKLANGLGKKVALIEKDKLGGECTWYGCVPSKALLRSAYTAHQATRLEEFGLRSEKGLSINTDGVMDHVRSIVRKVYDGHRAESFEKIGIKVLFGSPEFIDNHQIRINDKVISAKKFIIATGSSPATPPIEGLEDVPYLTNTTVFDIEKLPSSMTVIGGGPIGIELSSAFNRLGVSVTVLERGRHILENEDRELSELLLKRLRGEGITILTEANVLRVDKLDGSIITTLDAGDGKQHRIGSDTLLVAVGRKPNTEGLALEKAGVEYNRKGIVVDETLRTTAKNIYACGDVVGPYQFSHIAEYHATIAVPNALFPFKRKVNYDHVIWCTFTDPELAHAGLTEEEAHQRWGNKIQVYKYWYRNSDRAKTDLEETGFSKYICDPKGKILGVHIIGHGAGDLIHEVQLAKALGVSFKKIYPVIHIYPTLSDVVKRPAQACYIDILQNNPFVKLARKLF